MNVPGTLTLPRDARVPPSPAQRERVGVRGLIPRNRILH